MKQAIHAAPPHLSIATDTPADGIDHHFDFDLARAAFHHGDATSEDNRVVAGLLAKRQLDPTSGCWLWQGRRDKWGCGRITVAHRRWSVHPLAAHLYLGLDPESHFHVLQRCHNPACFRRMSRSS
jgi:hypothetical protein